MVVMFIGVWLCAGLIPPPKPHESALQIQRLWSDHTDLKRLGLLLVMVAGALTAPFVAVISVQLRRIEGRNCMMSYAQLGLGMVGITAFIFPTMFMEVAAFRPHRDPALTLLINDLGWLTFVGMWMFATFQCFAIAIAVFKDEHEQVFPRWLAYFNIWVGTLFVPGSLIYFFKSGAFSWAGAFCFWLPLSVFGIWFVVMVVMLLRATDRQLQTATA